MICCNFLKMYIFLEMGRGGSRGGPGGSGGCSGDSREVSRICPEWAWGARGGPGSSTRVRGGPGSPWGIPGGLPGAPWKALGRSRGALGGPLGGARARGILNGLLFGDGGPFVDPLSSKQRIPGWSSGDFHGIPSPGIPGQTR